MTTLFENRAIEEIPSAEEWEYKFVEDFSKGINVSLYPQRIDEQQLLRADNVRDQLGRLVLAYGYRSFGPTVRGMPRATYQMFFKDGSSKLVLITNDTFYEWQDAIQAWWYVSDGVATTLSGAGVATDTVLDVVDDTGFGDGDFIGIVLDDGTQHQTTINGAPAANQITITDALPSGAAIGLAVVKAVDLNGMDDVQVSLTTWAAFDKMYFANGSDAPKQYDGLTCEDISNLPATTFSCRLVQVYQDYLLLMHTVEDGTAFPQRVRWCQPADPTNWNESVNFQDLYRTEDWIVATEGLGPYQIVYKERSIIRMELVASTTQTFDFVTTVKSEGALSQDAVVDLGDSHLLLGNSNIYEYEGGFDLTPVGDRVWEKIFGNSGELNPSEKQKAFQIYVEELDENWFFYPAADDEFNKHVVSLKNASGGWTARGYPINITGFGFFARTTTVTWATAQGTWEEASGPWVGSQLSANSPTLHLCSWDGIDGQIYELDYTATDDNGTAIAYAVETRDFYYPNRSIRTNRFDFKLAGTGILIEYSVDEGENWKILKTVSPGSVLQRVRIHKQIVCRTLRFRLSGSQGFGLQWLAFTWKRESVWDA